MAKVAVSFEPGQAALEVRARELASELDAKLVAPGQSTDAELIVLVKEGGLELVAIRGLAACRGSKPFHVEVGKIDVRSGGGRSRRQPLARAVGVGKSSQAHPTVLDATAGWGQDAWLLAMLGCQVLAVERNAVVAVMLVDGLRRMRTQAPEGAERLMVTRGEARALDLLPWRFQHFLRPDVVYLDPMFHYGARGRHGKERRPLVLLRQLVGDDADAEGLLDWALSRAQRRVVVKRPRHGPFLAGRKPAASHLGKSLRWDVYPAM